MSNTCDAHQSPGIIDNVDDAPVAYTNAPLISKALQLLAARRAWRNPQCFQFANHPRQDRIIQKIKFLPG
jgi:hypothetical protein